MKRIRTGLGISIIFFISSINLKMKAMNVLSGAVLLIVLTGVSYGTKTVTPPSTK